MSNTSPFSNAVSRHDVDFFGILKLIWQGRRLILLLSTLFGLSAYTYTRLITSEYQVASVLRPVALNRSGVYTLPPDEALTRVGSALESYGVRLGFLERIRHCSVICSGQALRLSRALSPSIELR